MSGNRSGKVRLARPAPRAATGTLRSGLVIAYGIVLAALSVWRIALMIPREMDLGVLINGLAVFAESGPSGSISYLGFGILGGHMEVFSLVFAPLVGWPYLPQLLVTTQAASIAWAVWIVADRTASLTPDRRLWVLVPAAAALHPAVLHAALFDVHANVMSLGLLAAFVVALQGQRWARAVGLGLAAALFREDIAAVVVLMTVFRWSDVPRRARLALTVMPVVLIGAHLFQGANDLGRSNLFGYVDLARPAQTAMTAFGFFFEHGWIIAVAVIVALPLGLLGKIDLRTLAPALLASFPIAIGEVPGGRTVAYHYYAIVIVCWALALRFDRAPRPAFVSAGAGIAGLWLVLGPIGVSAFGSEPVANSIPQMAAVAREQNPDLYRELSAGMRCVEGHGPISVVPEATPHTRDRTDLYLYPQPFADKTVGTGRGMLLYPVPDLGPPAAIIALDPIQVPGYVADQNIPIVYWRADSGVVCDAGTGGS